MSHSRAKRIILIVAVLQIVLIIAFMALPAAVQAIPGRYRVALQERYPSLSMVAEGVIDRVAPVPTALPAPASNSGAESVDFTALLAIAPTTAADSGSVVAIAPASPTHMPAMEQPETAAVTAAGANAAVTAMPGLAVAPTETPVPEPTATPTLEPLPSQVTLPGMGVIRQTFNNCGPANLTQVLNFYGDDRTQGDVARLLKPNSEDRNVSPWQIADYVNENSAFVATVHSGGTLEMLKRFVAAGLPVVVEKGYQLPESGWWGHYLTIFGYDDAEAVFYTQDSYLGPWDGSGRNATYEEMAQFWQQFNYTFYVIYEPAQETIVHQILGPDMLDEFTMWRNAAALAEEQTLTDTDNAYAWFNLGTSLTRLGALTGDGDFYAAGAQAFDRARTIGLPQRMLWYQFQPYLAYWKVGRHQDVIDLADATLQTQGGRNVEETYWYKGHALLSLGEVEAARTAYQSALDVNVNFYPAQWSLDSLN